MRSLLPKVTQTEERTMGKISPVSSKYIVHSSIEIDGVVDRPDVIGAIFGQTEGLLGADLELRELQRSGRIGRIEVNTETKTGKTRGEIIIPSSLDKAETAIIGAALEIIQKIGPCNARIKVEKIEDVRISKRTFVIERAKQLLKQLMETSMPDSQEIAEEVSASVRVMEIQEYGRERLPAGPAIDESDDIIIVEGRADVLTLLKNGFKNAIAINGTSVPQTVIELCRNKETTVFVDGDRGGDLIIKELLSVTEIDFVIKAPDGKEVEELTKKEIHKALRSRIAAEQVILEMPNASPLVNSDDKRLSQKQYMRMPSQNGQNREAVQSVANNGSPSQGGPAPVQLRPPMQGQSSQGSFAQAPPVLKKQSKVTPEEKVKFSALLNDLIGTRGAFILDEKLNVLGKVPTTELPTTLKSLSSGVYAILLDGSIDRDLLAVAERASVSYIIGMDAKVKSGMRTNVLTVGEL